MIQKVKGTYDLFNEEAREVQELKKIINELMVTYNYQYIQTPIIESSELFHRTIGETTDIVSKETYDFIDRGNRKISLRPEGTACIARSFIENKMYGIPNQPIKNWYYGPMYRYERPQSGRYREFYQFGVEVFGSNDPMIDVEVISIPVNLYQMLGLTGIKVKINSLGDSSSRENYRNALLDYFKPHLDHLCDDCQKRYLKNPLRIIDCKVDSENEIIKNAPRMIDYLNDYSRNHFEKVKEYLEALGIEYEVDTRLVRGIDYYTHTVFEVHANIEGFGSQNALCGGGRYNSLIENLDGPETPAMGFALGVERLMTALNMENIKLVDNAGIDIYIIPVSENEKTYALSLTNCLRMAGFITDTDYVGRNLKSNFKQADRLMAKYNIIIGEEEIKSNILTIKNNQTKDEEKVNVDTLLEYFDDCLNECNCEGGCHHE